MQFSRRRFVRTLGWTGLGTAAAAWHPANLAAGHLTAPQGAPAQVSPLAAIVKIDSNENPYGPGPAVAEAVQQSFSLAHRYFRGAGALASRIAALHDISGDRVLLGCGSGELLRAASAAFTTPTKAAVVPSPTFETTANSAAALGHPVREVRVDKDLRLDLDAMEKAAVGAGLIYVCNPNNPTATSRAARDIEAFVGRVLAATPDATILIDEAYHEFADDPGYATAVPLTAKSPRVIVLRTFSKIYGMAGLRVGYAIAHPDTLSAMGPYVGIGTMSVMSAAAAHAALDDRARVTDQQRLNRETRLFTRRLFEEAGYSVAASDANFVMVDVRRPASEFRSVCRARGVLVGRPFPPLDTWVRITIGTAEEMRRAAEIFREILGTTSSAARKASA
jgi:histidinol-phosphate aminotransferase